MKTRKRNAKHVKLDEDFIVDDYDDRASVSSNNDPDDPEEVRKSKIRDSNHEFAKRMTILQSWSEHWSDYTTREGSAYPQREARSIIKKAKKIACPIEKCGKTFTSIGGLKYHYARCNITRCFKCKVCDPPMQLSTRGELLRHMIILHSQDLPDLNDDQKQIVSAYLRCEHRNEKVKKEKKASTDTEATYSVGRNVGAFKELQNRAFVSENDAYRVYKQWQPSPKYWEQVTFEIDRRRYYPPELESLNVKIESEEKWTKLKAGEFSVLTTDKRGSPISSLFFTGGINTAAAWLPKPLHDENSTTSPDLVAISVNCCPMDRSFTYKEAQDVDGCIQFWTINHSSESSNEATPGNESNNSESTSSISYMVGHSYGTIFDMHWCPLGASWQSQLADESVLPRAGLLALACGDGLVRILSIPHTSILLDKAHIRKGRSIIEATPIFRVKPLTTLVNPGACPTTDYQAASCKTICWGFEDHQRFIAAGYSNGTVALFDLANNSPILYTNVEETHVYQPLKSWIAHGAPVTGIAISSITPERTLIATGSTDRQLKFWNLMDLHSCITTDRAPITKILWDFRLRGVITATDSAFTSFINRVSYRYPLVENSHHTTVSTHRSTVWGLSNSIITNAIATSDGAGEVFVLPQLVCKSTHKKQDKGILGTHSLFTLIPRDLDDSDRETVIKFASTNSEQQGQVDNRSEDPIRSMNGAKESSTGGGCDGDNPSNSISNQSQPNEVKTEEVLIDEAPDFSSIERPCQNLPKKFLLPIERRAVETYTDFKANFGLEFVHYASTSADTDVMLPESCSRASDLQNIYCDRPCDYPFSSINLVTWSPNVNTYSHLLSGTQVGLCRLDRVQIVEQIYGSSVNSLLPKTTQVSNQN